MAIFFQLFTQVYPHPLFTLSLSPQNSRSRRHSRHGRRGGDGLPLRGPRRVLCEPLRPTGHLGAALPLGDDVALGADDGHGALVLGDLEDDDAVGEGKEGVVGPAADVVARVELR